MKKLLKILWFALASMIANRLIALGDAFLYIGERFGAYAVKYALRAEIVAQDAKNPTNKLNLNEGQWLVVNCRGNRKVIAVYNEYIELESEAGKKEFWPVDDLEKMGFTKVDRDLLDIESKSLQEIGWEIHSFCLDGQGAADCNCEFCAELDYKYCESGDTMRFCLSCEWEGAADEAELQAFYDAEASVIYDECCPKCGEFLCIGGKEVVTGYNKVIPF